MSMAICTGDAVVALLSRVLHWFSGMFHRLTLLMEQHKLTKKNQQLNNIESSTEHWELILTLHVDNFICKKGI